MFLTAVLLVLLSGLMNAVWNLLAKRSRNKGIFLSSIIILCNAVLLPFMVAEMVNQTYPAQGWLLLFLSMASQAGYALLLTQVYSMGDLSQVYPIQRGTSVVLIPLIGVLLLGENLSLLGWLGVILIVLGVVMLSFWRQAPQALDSLGCMPVITAIGIGICITTYVIIDKLALSYFSPFVLLGASNLGFLLGNVSALMHWNEVKQEWTLNWKTMLIGSFLMPGSYFLFLVAMKLAPISHLAPVREVGTVFAALFGVWILKEEQGSKRIGTAVVIACGIIIVGLNP